MSRKMNRNELNRGRLRLAAQMFFDCQMEIAYHQEGYAIPEYLAKISIAKDYVREFVNHSDYPLLLEFISDCEKAIQASEDAEYLMGIFQCPINFIDNNFEDIWKGNKK